MIGTISRWGSRGYGFVIGDDSTIEAWLHLKFVEDPGYQPRQGDRVEFMLEKLPDGRHQAKRVRRAGMPATFRPRTITDLPRPAPSGFVGATGLRAPLFGSGGALQAALLRAEIVARPSPSAGPSPSRPEEEQANLNGHAPVEQAAPSLVETPLEARILDARSRRTGELAELRNELFAVETSLRELEDRRLGLARELAEREAGTFDLEAELMTAHVAHRADSLEHALVENRRIRESFEAARMAAITAFGLPPVDHYLELRRRLHDAQEKSDALAESAFRMLERERRVILRDLADALDRVEAMPPLRATFVAFLPDPARSPISDEPAGRAVLVAPLRAEWLAAQGTQLGSRDPRVPMVCAFFHLAERAARELSTAEGPATTIVNGMDPVEQAPRIDVPRLEYGVVAGCLAVRFAASDGALLELLLDETWSGRPSLESSGIEPELESVLGALPPWSPEADVDSADEDLVAAAGGAAGTAMALPDVAARLGLSLRDLVAMLYDRGLPFPDDAVDAGTEQTLRALLGDSAADADETTPSAVAAAEARVDADHRASIDPLDEDDAPSGEGTIESGPRVASRMLRKLLRDRRVGGRHTRIENAYGHHFSDGEKLIARRVAEWLEKLGILLPKLNEGSHHISINPRRLREVGQIIDGTWADAAVFEQL